MIAKGGDTGKFPAPFTFPGSLEEVKDLNIDLGLIIHTMILQQLALVSLLFYDYTVIQRVFCKFYWCNRIRHEFPPLPLPPIISHRIYIAKPASFASAEPIPCWRYDASCIL